MLALSMHAAWQNGVRHRISAAAACPITAKAPNTGIPHCSQHDKPEHTRPSSFGKKLHLPGNAFGVADVRARCLVTCGLPSSSGMVMKVFLTAKLTRSPTPASPLFGLVLTPC